MLGPAHPFRRPPRAPLLSRLFCALAPLCASQELQAKLRQTCDPEDRKRRAEARASWISPSPPALLPAADLPCPSPLRAQAVAKREAALREREEAVAAAAAEYKPRYKPRTKKAAQTEVRAPAPPPPPPPRLRPRHLLLLRLLRPLASVAPHLLHRLLNQALLAIKAQEVVVMHRLVSVQRELQRSQSESAVVEARQRNKRIVQEMKADMDTRVGRDLNAKFASIEMAPPD